MSPFSHIFELPKKHPKKRRSFLFTKHIKCSQKPVALDWNINQHLGDLGLTPHKIGSLCLSLTILPYHRFLTCRRFTDAENRLGNPGCQLRVCWSKHSYEISWNISVIKAELCLWMWKKKKKVGQTWSVINITSPSKIPCHDFKKTIIWVWLQGRVLTKKVDNWLGRKVTEKFRQKSGWFQPVSLDQQFFSDKKKTTDQPRD